MRSSTLVPVTSFCYYSRQNNFLGEKWIHLWLIGYAEALVPLAFESILPVKCIMYGTECIVVADEFH